MALILEANYSKKIGLPGYSSHQFSITLKIEIADSGQVQAESARLYALLQGSVDQSLQKPGWLPEGRPANNPGNGNGNGSNPGNGSGPATTQPAGDRWNCSDKQRDLIQRIVDENRLDKNVIEQLALDRFGKGVRTLNKLEASGLIDELFEKYPGNGGGNGNGNGNQRRRYSNHQRPNVPTAR